MSFAAQCNDEIKQLHEFFQNWFNGEVPDHDNVFQRLDAVLAPGFHLITPEGQVMSRIRVCEMVRGAHPARRPGSAAPPVRIWIENPRQMVQAPTLALVLYEEWQSRASEPRGRLTSALFHAKKSLPNEVEWLHVHETWLNRASS